MKNILDIMSICGCSKEVAMAVFTRMCCEDFDFSECTDRQFRRAALRAFEKMTEK
jgi:hypothetical protein